MLDIVFSLKLNNDHYKTIEINKMNQIKLIAGQIIPETEVATLSGVDMELFTPTGKHDWKIVVVYRGKHCPICTDYLIELNSIAPQLSQLGIDVAAVSADTKQQAIEHTSQLNLGFEVGYGLSVEQMELLGLYISSPRSPDETDHPFAEPALFVINEKRQIQVVDTSNTPFARPELKSMLMGLTFIRNPGNNYPIRGTYS